MVNEMFFNLRIPIKDLRKSFFIMHFEKGDIDFKMNFNSMQIILRDKNKMYISEVNTSVTTIGIITLYNVDKNFFNNLNDELVITKIVDGNVFYLDKNRKERKIKGEYHKWFGY